MKWYKHSCYPEQDLEFERFYAAAGLEGWGFLTRVFAKVGAAYKPGKRPEATYPIKTWCSYLGIHRNRFNKLLTIADTHGVLHANLACTGGVTVRLEACSTQDTLTLYCPKLLEMKDEYSRKSGHSPDNIPHKDEDEDRENRRRDQTNDLSDHLISVERHSTESPNIVSFQPGEVENFTRRIVDATGDPSFGRNGARTAIAAILNAGLYDNLDDEVDHVEKDQDPNNAEARGRSLVENPAAYMQSALGRLRDAAAGQSTRRHT